MEKFVRYLAYSVWQEGISFLDQSFIIIFIFIFVYKIIFNSSNL
jgi:hypothetical protein